MPQRRDWKQEVMQLRSLAARLLKRGKVDTVAVLDLDGSVKMISEDMELSKRDINTLLTALRVGDRPPTLMKIPLRNKTFTCMFQSSYMGSPGPLVGKAEDEMFAAVRTSKCIVVGFSDLESPGSCIYEISEMARVIECKGR